MLVHLRLNIDIVKIVVNGDLATVALINTFYHIVHRRGNNGLFYQHRTEQFFAVPSLCL